MAMITWPRKEPGLLQPWYLLCPTGLIRSLHVKDQQIFGHRSIKWYTGIKRVVKIDGQRQIIKREKNDFSFVFARVLKNYFKVSCIIAIIGFSSWADMLISNGNSVTLLVVWERLLNLRFRNVGAKSHFMEFYGRRHIPCWLAPMIVTVWGVAVL